MLSVEMAQQQQQQQQQQRRSRQQLEAATEDTPDAEKDGQNKPGADKDVPASKRRRKAYI